MPVIKHISDSLFGWISPRSKHQNRDVKAAKSLGVRPAALQTRPSKARSQSLVGTGSAASSKARVATRLQVATGNVNIRRKPRRSGEIPWENPPSSPLIVQSIEHGLATTYLDDDEEMEDGGDEGAVDEMSDEDDSGFMEDDEDEANIASNEHARSSQLDMLTGEPVATRSMARYETSQADATSVSSRSETNDMLEFDEEDDILDANEKTKLTDLERDHEAALKAATQSFGDEREAKFEQQKIDAMMMIRDGWHLDTVDLFMLLERRVYETLLPDVWHKDFPLFPWDIFTEDYRKAFLAGKDEQEDYLMVRATRELLKLPVHVRNQLRIRAWHGRRAEAMVVKYCEEYMKLIHKDANLYIALKRRKLWSLICYAPGDEKSPAGELEDLILRRLRKRAGKILDILRTDEKEPLPGRREESDLFWHDGTGYLYEPPTLFGIVAKEAVVALVAYEPLSPRDALRPIAFFHMSKPNYDVWNGLALAILMCHCRNHLCKIKGRLPEDLDDLELTDEDQDS